MQTQSKAGLPLACSSLLPLWENDPSQYLSTFIPVVAAAQAALHMRERRDRSWGKKEEKEGPARPTGRCGAELATIISGAARGFPIGELYMNLHFFKEKLQVSRRRMMLSLVGVWRQKIVLQV